MIEHCDFESEMRGILELAYTDRRPLAEISVGEEKLPSERFGRDRWSFRLRLPEISAGRTAVLRFDMRKRRDPLTKSALVSIGGIPFHALDSYHGTVVLPPREGGILRVDLDIVPNDSHPEGGKRSPSDLPEGLGTLEFAERDPDLWRLANTLRFLHRASLSVRGAQGDDIRERLYGAIEFFRRNPGQPEEARKQAEAIRLPQGRNARALCFGHAHIDLAWLWPIPETICKCGATFATMLRLLEQYPEFVFVQSSAPFYLWVREHYPELWPQIESRVREGRWEVCTGTWVETDANVAGGESLVRQILWGKTFARETFGIEIDTLWLPDTFGFTAALPQLMKKAGISHFATIKLLWNDTTPFPLHSFWWEGLDGSRVFAHIPPSGDYNSELEPYSLSQAIEKMAGRAPAGAKVLAYPYGFGDGGGGPTDEMLENWRILRARKDSPQVEQRGLSAALKEIAAVSQDLPCWHGELYLEEHRGTYTTQGAVKKANRRAEGLYRDAECIASLAWACGFDYPAKALDRGWEKILRNQFHDILPGSSIHAVYEQAAADYAECEEIGMRVLSDAAEHFAARTDTRGPGEAVIAWNTLSWKRSGELTLPAAENCRMVDELGEEMPSQEIQEGCGKSLLFLAPEIPACGFRVFYLQRNPAERSVQELEISSRRMESRRFRLEFGESGAISFLYDKLLEREILAGPGDEWQLFDDLPSRWDAWNIDAGYEKAPREFAGSPEFEILESGPVRATLRIRQSLGEKSFAERDISIWANLGRIDFRCRVDWREEHKLLKASFPLAVHSREIKSETQFGHVRRPTHRNTSHEQARFEFPAHKWVDFSQADWGVGMLNDCKYGHDAHMNRVRITLLRSPKQPDSEADMGVHRFSYALWPHAGDLAAGGTIEGGYEFNCPLLAVPAGNHPGEFPGAFGFLELEGRGAILETLKRGHSKDRLVFRFYESLGGSCRARMKAHFPLSDLAECDLLERAERHVAMDSDQVSFELNPFEIKTFSGLCVS